MSWEFNKEPYCKARMEVHVLRFKNALLKPWAVGWKGRRGYADLSHAYVNLFVEFARACPYTAGHVAAFALPVAILAVGIL